LPHEPKPEYDRQIEVSHGFGLVATRMR
jgi:hypothetical protein